MPSPLQRLRAWRDRGRSRRAFEQAVVRVRGCLHVVGGALPEALPPDTPVVLTVVRDAGAWLDAFFEHHRARGFRAFVLVDDRSQDDSVDRALAEPGVLVLSFAGSWRTQQGALRVHLRRTYGSGRWSLLVDADELFDWPDADVVDLPALLAYLDGTGATAMASWMVDRFPAGPLRAAPAGDPRVAHPLHDLDDVRSKPYPRGANRRPRVPLHLRYGGVRTRVFGLHSPLLTKHPLVRGDGRAEAPEGHPHVIAGARLADVEGVLLHLKFAGDFPARVAQAVEEGQYWRGSIEYRLYAEALRRNPDLGLEGPGSRPWTGVDALDRAGFLTVSPRWRRLAAARRRPGG